MSRSSISRKKSSLGVVHSRGSGISREGTSDSLRSIKTIESGYSAVIRDNRVRKVDEIQKIFFRFEGNAD